MTIVLAYPPRPKWPPYCWKCAKHFGEACYRTWKEELLFAFISVPIAFVISKGTDPRAETVVGDPNASVPNRYGVFGVLILLGLIVGGAVLGRSVYAALPKAQVEIVIRTPPPPTIELTPENRPILTMINGGKPLNGNNKYLTFFRRSR